MFNTLLQKAKECNEHFDAEQLTRVYEFVENAHKDISRKSGEPYINHLIRTGINLCEAGLCEETMLCAALLHDVVEDTNYKNEEIAKKFGSEVASIVLALTKLTEQEVGYEHYKAENLRKIILASSKDVRVMLIKIAERLDNMRTLSVFREDKQKRIANETLHIYAPVAEKMGMYSWKAELEDLSFKYLEPTLYNFVLSKIEASQEEREKNTKDLIKKISEILHKFDLRITGRAKHIYSIYKKMMSENKTISQIYDIYGIRIIANSADECYAVSSIIKQHWKHVREKDFIKNPKPNGYQSLHDNFEVDDKIVEVQIRTREMDYQAESGVALYWKYKGTERDKKFDKKINWLKQVLRWKRKTKNQTKIDIFADEIITITPQGDPIILSEGATPIDFAYQIHSNVGNYMKVAKVNGKIVPLNHELGSADIVEIETSKEMMVNESWLKFAKQPSTASKIRKALGIESELSSKKARELVKKTQTLDNTYQTFDQFRDLLGRKKPIKISKCCDPKPTDPIVAFYTKDKKLITVHKVDCPHQYALNQANKVIIKPKPVLKSNVVIDLLIDETPGALIEILNELLSQKLNILQVTSRETKTLLYVSVTFKQHTYDVSRIKKIQGVHDVKVVE